MNKNYSSCFIFKYTEILSVAPRHIFNSLLDAWPIQASRLRDIQRRWPVLDATAPRGSLRPHHDQQSIPNRRSRTTQVPLASLASVPLPPPREDGTIPLPQVPNVAAEKIRDLASNGYLQRQCGDCHYFWRGMALDVSRYVRSCPHCQQIVMKTTLIGVTS